MLPENDVASLVPSGALLFCPEIKGFSEIPADHRRGRVCRAGHHLPCALCCAPDRKNGKSPRNQRQKFWSGPCYGFCDVKARMVRGSQNIWIRLLPAIATSMIAAAGSPIRAAAPPQDQSQATAADSPFAILLAALSAQGAPAGEGANAGVDMEAPSDAAAPDLPPSDQAGQAGKSVAAASEKSNTDDHVAEAVLAALLMNGTAAPAPFSRPETSQTTASASIPDMPEPVMADDDKSKPANAGPNPQPDASTQLGSAVPSVAPSVTNAPIDPAPSAPSDVSATPPASGDKAGSHITDPTTADASTDPILFAAANAPALQPVCSVKTGPEPRTSDASDTDASPASKSQPEKKSAAPDQSKIGTAPAMTDAAPAIIAAAVAGPVTAGQVSTDQTGNPAVTVDAIQSLSAGTTPANAKPAKDATATGPVTVTPSDSDDTEEPATADVLPEIGSPIAATLAAVAKAATMPAKSAGASTKPAANAQAATDAPPPGSEDKPQIPSTAHGIAAAHAAASKTDAAASDDSTNVVQPDATNVVPAVAGAAPHTAPPSLQPVAIFDPSAIVAPHAASATSPGTNAAASLQISSTASDSAPDLNGFAVNIAARSLSGAKQFEIRLDPPELGRVDVRLSIDAAGKAVAHMATDQPQTLDLLRKDAPALTQALRDAGLDVSQNGLNFSLRGQDRQSGDNQNGPQSRKSSLSARLAIQAAQAPAALAYAGAASNARLDIHV
jgi:flagellar hook-length control protein FliK